MSKVLVTESNLQDIADAIRSKNEGTDTYRPGDMAAAILAIPTGGGSSTLVSKTITQNGEYDPEDDNADGYSDVTVNVPNSYGASDEGKVVSSGALVAQTSRNVTANGTYDTTENNEVVVNVSGGGGGMSASIAVENGAVTSNGVTVQSQPVITDDQMGASSSAGLAFAMAEIVSLSLQIEFDLTIKSGGSSIVLSFGGSNTSGGVYVIDTQKFQLYASGVRFNVTITLTEEVKYRIKILMTPNSATLYVDGAQIAVGQSGSVANAIDYVLIGNNVAVLFNQSEHSEYNNSLVDNIVMQFV